MQGWIGVDLDGTLAEYHDWRGIEHIGEPVPKMLARVKQWLKEGKQVKIFTARVCNMDGRAKLARAYIDAWSLVHIGQILEVTCQKDFLMTELWDDRCVQIEENTGELARESARPFIVNEGIVKGTR
jgi:hypothetical protein